MVRRPKKFVAIGKTLSGMALRVWVSAKTDKVLGPTNWKLQAGIMGETKAVKK